MSLAKRFDGWVNSLTGLGGWRDKAQAAVFARFGRSDDETLEAMYEEDDMAAKVAEAGPDHMLREGFKVVVEGEPETGPLMDEFLESLGGVTHITDALVWENVFGGSVNVLGLDDGRDVIEPLDEESIEGFYFINTLDRRDCIPVYWYSDPNSGKYGKPSVYRITYISQGMERPVPGEAPKFTKHTLEVHESRLLIYTGLRTTFRSRLRYNGWGVPLLSRLRVPLRGFHANWQSVENMMTDASQGVFKLKGLIEMIASGGMEALSTRMQFTDMTRSSARAIMVDADLEDFTRRDTSMSGLPELLDRTMGRLSGAASMPVTVLGGTSPGGLNATGASDIRNWYDVLAAMRTRRVKPKIKRMVLLAFKCRKGPTGGRVPAKWDIEFAPLWQETAKEKADTELTEAQADATRIQSGVITGAEAAIRRADQLGIDVEARLKEMQGYEDDLEDPSKPLPPRPMAGGLPDPSKPSPDPSKPQQPATK